MVRRPRTNLTIPVLFIAVVLIVAISSCEDDGCPTCPPCDNATHAGWFQQACPIQESLTRIDVIDGSTVVAVGRAGTILKTTTGGF